MISSCQIEKFSVETQGVIGTLFLPRINSQTALPVVITLGGAGGAELSEFRAAQLASHGFATFALVYFGRPPLPPQLQEIPLEYFEKAIFWLASHPAIDSKRLGLWGVSRGAELSLILGSFFSQKISAIAAYVPSSVVYGSLIAPNKPAWIYQGKPIAPSAPFPFGIEHLQAHRDAAIPIALTPFFLEGMKNGQVFEESAIAVEKLECPLLLISGEDDRMWPSTLFCSQIAARLKIKKPSLSCVHYSYPNAGHFITPSLQRIHAAQIHGIAPFWFGFGGNPEADLQATLDAWEKTVQFFNVSLKKSIAKSPAS